MVRRRSGWSRGPSARSGSRGSSRASSASGERRAVRAAAGSIASGSPSARSQMATTAAAFSGVRLNAALAASARSTNRRTASIAINSASGGSGVASRPLGDCRGNASGGTAKTRSPERWSAARLVTSSVNHGHAARSSDKAGPAEVNCSKLSRMSSVSRSRRYCRKRSAGGFSSPPRISSARTIAASTRSGSRTAASGTNAAPSP